MRSIAAIFILSLLSLAPAVGQERQISFHENLDLYVLTKEVNKKHNFLPAFPTTVEARLFVETDSSYVLDLILDDNGSRLRKREQLTQADFTSLRQRVTAAIPRQPVLQPLTDELDQSGRGALLWGTTLWSLFYYGAASSIAFTGEANTAWPFLIAGGMGYLVPALLTNSAPVSEGASSLALGGMFQGVLHGWALTALISGSSLEDSPRLGAGLSVLGGITEGVAGYLVATNTGMSEGRAGAINTTSFYGLVVGGLTSVIVFDAVDIDSDPAVRIAGGAGLAGAVAGMFIGDALADDQPFTSGDASVYAVSGALGLTLPYAVLTTIQPTDVSPALIAGLGVVGTVGGLWLGTELIRHVDFRDADGTMIVLSSVGGGLLGLGAAIAIDDGTTAAVLPWLGAAGGFALGLHLSKPTDESSSSMGSLEFNVNPFGPLMVSTDRQGVARPAPFLTATYRF